MIYVPLLNRMKKGVTSNVSGVSTNRVITNKWLNAKIVGMSTSHKSCNSQMNALYHKWDFPAN